MPPIKEYESLNEACVICESANGRSRKDANIINEVSLEEGKNEIKRNTSSHAELKMSFHLMNYNNLQREGSVAKCHRLMMIFSEASVRVGVFTNYC